MQRLFSLIILSFTIVCSNAQEPQYFIKVVPQGSRSWGYADINGNLVIDAKYTWSFGFGADGVAAVHTGNVRDYDLIDTEGREIKTDVDKFFPYVLGWNPAQVQEVFHDGIMVVSLNKTGTALAGMNADGKLVTSSKYTWLSSFENGFAIGKIDKDKYNDEYYIVNANGTEVSVTINGISAARNISEGLAPLELNEDKWGFINTEGELEIDAVYNTVGYFKGGLAWARADDGKIGFINKSGEWAIEPVFLSAKEFDPESGMAMAKLEEGWRYINKEGEAFQFNGDAKLYGFSNGLAISRREADRKIGFIDNTGDWAIEPQFENARDFVNGFAAVQKNRLWGLIDKKGTWVIEPKFSKLMDAFPVNN